MMMMMIIIIIMSRDNMVDIVTRPQAERAGSTLSLFSRTSRPAQGPTQPLVQWETVLFPMVKAAGACC
jgi:hypothetical protein